MMFLTDDELTELTGKRTVYTWTDELRAALQEKSERATALERSTSWRLTAPLRRISGWVRK